MRHVTTLAWTLWMFGCAKTQPEPPTDTPTLVHAEPSGGSTLDELLFPAELVMNHQAAIGLDDAQSTAIRGELAAAQAELVEAEWALRRDRESLAALVAHERVDEEAAMQAADRVIAREDDVKRIHLRLLIRIKNRLTPTQRAQLSALRRE